MADVALDIFQAIVILALIVLALPERRVFDPDPDDPDRTDAPEVPHFLDLTQVSTASADPSDGDGGHSGPSDGTSDGPREVVLEDEAESVASTAQALLCRPNERLRGCGSRWALSGAAAGSLFGTSRRATSTSSSTT